MLPAMPFVNEIVPDQIKPQLHAQGFRHPLGVGEIKLYKWTVDRARDVFLLPLGNEPGGHDMRQFFFALSVRGAVAYFEACEHLNRFSDGDVLTWMGAHLELPEKLSLNRSEVISLLQESLEARGSVFGSAGLKKVQIDWN